MRAAVIAVILALSSTAVAQPGLTPPGLTPTSEPPPPALTRPQKDRGTATLLAVAGTLAPVLLFVAAIDSNEPGNLLLASGVAAILTPSAGHWYAGKAVTTGMGLRALGTGVASLSLMLLIASEGNAEGAERTFWLGTLTLGAGAVYDIATAGSAVDEWNREHAVMPTAFKTRDGYGIGMAARF